MTEFVEQALQYARGAANRQGLTVSVKTNLGGPVTVYRAGKKVTGPGLLERLGLRYGVIITDREGRELTTLGDPPPTDPKKQALALLALAGLAFVLARGLLP